MKRRICLFVATCFLCAFACAASARDAVTEEEPARMEEIVVTAARDKEEARKAPANVTVITAEEIRESGATTVPEVLERLEGVNFRSFSGNASQSAIDMRGFGGDNPFGRTLVLLDGRRLNRPDMASINWLQVPLGRIERIEVVRGAGSVLYGDAAVAGVIHIITRRGEGKPEFTVSGTAGSYGLHDESLGASGSAGKLSYAVTAENQQTSGYRERSQFKSQGGGIKLGYEASERLNLDLGLSFNQTDYDLPGALTKSRAEQDRRQAANPADENSERYFNAALKAESSWGDHGRLTVDFLYGRKDLTSDMASWWTFNKNLIDTYGAAPRFILDKELFGRGNKLLVGADYYYETFDADRYADREKTSKTAVVRLRKETLGYYIRDEFAVVPELILSAGYRAERGVIRGSDVDATMQTQIFDEKKVHHAEAYEAGLTYLVGKKSKAFAKYATVFRIPFTDEQAVYAGFGTDEFLKNLDKEKGKSYEAGAQFYPFDNLRIAATLFRIDMEDEITFNNATFRNENLDRTRHEGVECSVSYNVKTLGKIYGNFTYHRAVFQAGVNEGKTVPLVPARKINAGLEIYLPLHFTLRPEVRHASDAFQGGDNANTAEKIRSYTFYDLFLLYRAPVRNLDVSAFIGAENLTDERYDLILYNGYYPYPGITVKGGISLRF